MSEFKCTKGTEVNSLLRNNGGEVEHSTMCFLNLQSNKCASFCQPALPTMTLKKKLVRDHICSKKPSVPRQKTTMVRNWIFLFVCFMQVCDSICFVLLS